MNIVLMKKAVLLFLLLMGGICRAVSTPQIHDRLLFENDTMDLWSDPLSVYMDLYPAQGDKIVEKDFPNPTNCWRGYYATWQIENDTLYLVGVRSGKGEIDLAQCFGERCRDGRVWADWYTDALYAQYGRVVTLDMFRGKVRFRERYWLFDKGVVVAGQTKDYSTLTAEGRDDVVRIWYGDSLNTGRVVLDLTEYLKTHFRWTEAMTEKRSVHIVGHVADDLSFVVESGAEKEKRLLVPFIWDGRQDMSAEEKEKRDRINRYFRHKVDSLDRVMQQEDAYMKELKRVLSEVKVETILCMGKSNGFIYDQIYEFDPRTRTIRGRNKTMQEWREEWLSSQKIISDPDNH